MFAYLKQESNLSKRFIAILSKPAIVVLLGCVGGVIYCIQTAGRNELLPYAGL
jgi:hypothetical protein